MKNFYTIMVFLLVISSKESFSQEVGISDVVHTPNSSAVLDVYSTSKGILIPRITDSTAISSPVDGLFAYFTTTSTFWYYNSTKWCQIVGNNNADTIKFGGNNDYLAISQDGYITLEGDARAFDDLRTPVHTAKKDDIDPPGDITLISNLKTYGFDASKSEYIFFTAQLPHSYKEGTDVRPHIHWFPTNNGSGNVVWKLEYSWANINEVFPSATTISCTTAASGTDNTQQIAAFSNINGTGKKISSMLVCRLYREGGNSSDTYGSDAGFLEVDFHFEVDSFGSSQEFIK